MTSQAIKLSSHERDAVPFSHILPCNLNGTAPVWILPAQTGGNGGGGMGHCEVEFDPMKFSSERFFQRSRKGFLLITGATGGMTSL